MIKRLFDAVVAVIALLAAAPFIGVAAIGILLSSPGPVLFRAHRVGRHGMIFTMFKLRTMHITHNIASSITAPDDIRIFPFGKLIRILKIDELPQLWNILRGDMSLVGPRPEAPYIVEKHYTEWMNKTLLTRPGATSPGAIYNYLMADDLLDESDPEGSYVGSLLPPKLALELAYLERATLQSDLGYILLTVWVILARNIGINARLPEIDINNASKLVAIPGKNIK